MATYTRNELIETLGSIGENVSIHRSVEFFSPKSVYIGSNVRIDCFCLLSAGPSGIHLGDYIHIGAGCFLFGASGAIRVESFSTTSSRVVIYTANDDYVGGKLTNPTVPAKYRGVRVGDVTLRRHAIVGTGSTILPGVSVGLAASIGAMSLVKKDVADFEIVAGVPARRIGRRDQSILEREAQFLADLGES